jgi:hypothetical protein
MSDGRFAGVDWASEEHALCVVDGRGRILQGRRYRHNEPGIRALCARLVGLKVKLVARDSGWAPLRGCARAACRASDMSSCGCLAPPASEALAQRPASACLRGTRSTARGL